MKNEIVFNCNKYNTVTKRRIGKNIMSVMTMRCFRVAALPSIETGRAPVWPRDFDQLERRRR